MGELVKVHLLFFAKSREIIGSNQVTLVLPNLCSGKQLLDHIVKAYPKLNDIINSVVIALNEEYLELDKDIKLKENDELAIIPPISGTTRDNFEGKYVVQLEYEAYKPMAKKEMLEICHSIRTKWNVHNIALFHRIGVVPVKEASIIIAISSSHRKESLEAVQFAIDAVKAKVPIWKKIGYGKKSICSFHVNYLTNAMLQCSVSALFSVKMLFLLFEMNNMQMERIPGKKTKNVYGLFSSHQVIRLPINRHEVKIVDNIYHSMKCHT